jgi:hypothetical protein
LGGNDNVTVRMALVKAIVQEGRLEIDHFISPNNADLAEFNGHFYCDKAIGASLLAVPVYWVAWNVTQALNFERGIAHLVGLYFVTLLIVGVPTALACVLMYRLLADFEADVVRRLWTALAYGLGTWAWAYSTWFFGHQIAAVLAFAAFYLIYKMRRDGFNGLWLFLSGLAAGYSFLTDYPCAVIAAALGLYALYNVKCLTSNVQLENRSLVIGHWSLVIRRWSFYAIGVVLPVLVLMWYNWACFGNPLDTGYQHEVNPYFREQMAKGLMGIQLPQLEAFYGITLSPRRGLFFSSPYLLFGIAGWWALWRRGLRAEAWVCAVIVGAFVFINSSYYMWWGGTVYGARFLVPCLPFIAFPVIFALRLQPLPVKLLIVVSTMVQCVVVMTSPNVAEKVENPLVQENLRRIAQWQPNFNLMMLLGVDNWTSWLPFFAGMFLCGVLLYRAVAQHATRAIG